MRNGCVRENQWVWVSASVQDVKDSVHTSQRTQHMSITKTSQLMLYREILAVCSEIHTKHINTLCGQNVELLSVKLAVRAVAAGV
jgi:proteasome assembly chaperone (PAC2) family protein